MSSTWVASDGGSLWVAREGGQLPAVADQIEMAVNDNRKLTFDFGNCREFYDGGGINLTIPPVVATNPSSHLTISKIRQLPVVATTAQPIGLLLSLTYDNPEAYPDQWIGAYYVEFWCTSDSDVQTYTVSVTITLIDGTQLTRSGMLSVTAQ